MSQLSCHVSDYLAMRRALGFKLAKEGRLLLDFAAFAEAAGTSTVTTDLAVAWAILPRNASPVWAAQRLGILRGFTRYLPDQGLAGWPSSPAARPSRLTTSACSVSLSWPRRDRHHRDRALARARALRNSSDLHPPGRS
jgi:hypothetical protein